MDDLTKLKGIGAATAKELTVAGYTSLADIARADPSAPAGGASAETWLNWIEQAQALVHAAGGEPGGAAGATLPVPSGNPAPPALDPQSDPELEGPAIVVMGPKRGRWRAGRFFGPEPVRIPIAKLSEEDANAIAADLRLTIRTVGEIDF